jgi:chromosome partitioning protein
MNIPRIVVTNAKGGCGKTTITTNIASHYAERGLNVRLFDHDSQGSSLAWINRRSDSLNQIHGVDSSKNQGHRLTRSWQLHIPPETDVAIIDTPAGVDILELASLFQTNDSVLIPVLPSPIDIHATAHFIKKLLTIGHARKNMIRLAVVANRARKNTIVYQSLERFLYALNIPFISTLRDTQLYTRAIELGIGIQEIYSPKLAVDKEQWEPIFKWLEAPSNAESADVTSLGSLRTQQEE